MTTTERIANRRTAALYIAVVMSCEFITFYSLPSALPFSVNPTLCLILVQLPSLQQRLHLLHTRQQLPLGPPDEPTQLA